MHKDKTSLLYTQYNDVTSTIANVTFNTFARYQTQNPRNLVDRGCV